MDPQCESRLVQVPLEVLVRITRRISTVDVGNVRLSCKALERGLFNFFAYEFFRKKQFMVTSTSLQALIDISKHETLSPFLKHVIIATDRLELPSDFPSEAQRRVPRTDEVKARQALAYADFSYLMNTGGLRDMLTEAFSNLGKLEAVDIRNFNSLGRSRDGQHTTWRSWGSHTLEKSTDMGVVNTVRLGDHNETFGSRIFTAITAALAGANARPKSIEINLRDVGHPNEIVGLHDGAFYIPTSIEPAFSGVLSNLSTLHLVLRPSRLSPSKPFLYQKYLSLAPNLTWLRLNFTPKFEFGEFVEPFEILSWLAHSDDQLSLSPFEIPPIPLTKLERLDLGDVTISDRLLVDVIRRFAPTLTTMYLNRVCLKRDKPEVVNDFDSTASKISPWERFLSTVRKIPNLQLRTLTTRLPSHYIREGVRRRMLFWPGNPGAGSRVGEWTCSTNLESLDSALVRAIGAIDKDWLNDKEEKDEEPEDEEEEDDEEEESGDEDEDEDEDNEEEGS